MSPLGQNRKSRPCGRMSALPPSTDIVRLSRHVRKVPTRSTARCDRRAVIAASIRIYALVARGHRLRRDGRRRKRREIRVLVVTDPYAGIGDEPVSGGDRVARA
jgi:hypothetical protein